MKIRPGPSYNASTPQSVLGLSGVMYGAYAGAVAIDAALSGENLLPKTGIGPYH
jgi:hypothetical protein